MSGGSSLWGVETSEEIHAQLGGAQAWWGINQVVWLRLVGRALRAFRPCMALGGHPVGGWLCGHESGMPVGVTRWKAASSFMFGISKLPLCQSQYFGTPPHWSKSVGWVAPPPKITPVCGRWVYISDPEALPVGKMCLGASLNGCQEETPSEKLSYGLRYRNTKGDILP
jgi:hypothetical protein